MATMKKTLAFALVVINFILYMILLGFASWAFDRLLIHGTDWHGGNAATQYLVHFSLLASVLGLASAISGFWYQKRQESHAAACATALIALVVTLLAFGFSWKHVHLGIGHFRRLQALTAFAILVAITQLIYVLVIHGIVHDHTLAK